MRFPSNNDALTMLALVLAVTVGIVLGGDDVKQEQQVIQPGSLPSTGYQNSACRESCRPNCESACTANNISASTGNAAVTNTGAVAVQTSKQNTTAAGSPSSDFVVIPTIVERPETLKKWPSATVVPPGSVAVSQMFEKVVFFCFHSI